jgi:hypothetical protein
MRDGPKQELHLPDPILPNAFGICGFSLMRRHCCPHPPNAFGLRVECIRRIRFQPNADALLLSTPPNAFGRNVECIRHKPFATSGHPPSNPTESIQFPCDCLVPVVFVASTQGARRRLICSAVINALEIFFHVSVLPYLLL